MLNKKKLFLSRSLTNIPASMYCGTNKKSEYANPLQITTVHPTVGATASFPFIQNTSFYLSRGNKYLIMVLLVGLRHVLWSQAGSPLLGPFQA